MDLALNWQKGSTQNIGGGNSRILRCPRVLAAVLLWAALAAPICAYATTGVTLAWSASPDPAVAGYNIYVGVASGVYTQMIPTGSATSVFVPGLA